MVVKVIKKKKPKGKRRVKKQPRMKQKQNQTQRQVVNVYFDKAKRKARRTNAKGGTRPPIGARKYAPSFALPQVQLLGNVRPNDNSELINKLSMKNENDLIKKLRKEEIEPLQGIIDNIKDQFASTNALLLQEKEKNESSYLDGVMFGTNKNEAVRNQVQSEKKIKQEEDVIKDQFEDEASSIDESENISDEDLDAESMFNDEIARFKREEEESKQEILDYMKFLKATRDRLQQEKLQDVVKAQKQMGEIKNSEQYEDAGKSNKEEAGTHEQLLQDYPEEWKRLKSLREATNSTRKIHEHTTIKGLRGAIRRLEVRFKTSPAKTRGSR